jgi:NitT/TauT family transport system substrate-binding protein
MAYIVRIVMLENKYLEEEGLQVEATNIPGGSKAAAALLGGSADIVDLGFFHALKAAKKGFKVVGFACPMNRWPLSYLMKPETMKEKNITVNSTVDDKIKAMKGLTIGCTSAGSGTDLIPRAFLKNRNIDPDREVEFLPFGKMKAGVAAFETGKLDIFQWISPTPELLEQKGIGKILFSMAKGDVPEFRNYAWGSYFTTEEFINNKPEVVLKFTRAAMKAIEYIHNNEKGVLKIMAKRWSDASPELLKVSYDTMAPAVPSQPYITKEGWEVNMNIFFNSASAKEKELMAYNKTVNNEFVSKVLKEMEK